jgi:hypothetical protein
MGGAGGSRTAPTSSFLFQGDVISSREKPGQSGVEPPHSKARRAPSGARRPEARITNMDRQDTQDSLNVFVLSILYIHVNNRISLLVIPKRRHRFQKKNKGKAASSRRSPKRVAQSQAGWDSRWVGTRGFKAGGAQRLSTGGDTRIGRGWGHPRGGIGEICAICGLPVSVLGAVLGTQYRGALQRE